MHHIMAVMHQYAKHEYVNLSANFEILKAEIGKYDLYIGSEGCYTQ